MRTQTHKYAWFSKGGIEELYDLQNDPHEMQNLKKIDPNLTQHFKQQAIAWEKQHGFSETLNGDQFQILPATDPIPSEDACRTVTLNTGSWPKRLPKNEKDTVETFTNAFNQAIQKETSLSPDKLSIDLYNQELEKRDPLSHGSEGLAGTIWETK